MTDLTHAAWRKPRRSGGGNNCVEVASLQQVIAVRDSKNPADGSLIFSPEQWRTFISRVKTGHHDL